MEVRVVFTDLDGVFNSFGDDREFLPECVTEFNRITETTGAVVVVHSTWRWSQSLADIRQALEDAGVTGPIIDLTPNVTPESAEHAEFFEFEGCDRRFKHERPGSIQVWLDQHPDVDEFVIIDDDGRMGHLTDRLVETSLEAPLNRDHANEAIRMLRGAP